MWHVKLNIHLTFEHQWVSIEASDRKPKQNQTEKYNMRRMITIILKVVANFLLLSTVSGSH